MAVELVIRLPSVNNPGLNLQLVSGEPLDAQSIKKPRCVRGHERRLVGPVVEVVVAEQANVRHEDSRVDVQSVVHVEVVPAPRLRDVFVSIANIPLADPGAAIIARCGGRKKTKHGQDSAANVLPVEVAAEADLLHLEFAGPETLGRPTHRMVSRLIEILHEVGGATESFRSGEFQVEQIS